MIRPLTHIPLTIRSAGQFVAAFLVATSLVMALVAPATAQEPVQTPDSQSVSTVALDIVGGDSLSVDPGAVVTVVYRIAAQSDSTLHLTPRFDIPAGWSIVFGSKDIEVPAGERVTRFVTYKVPENALAGIYTPRFSVFPSNEESDASARLAEITSIVNVHSLHDLSITAGTTPSFLAAGKAFEVPLTVANDGNALIDVVLSADNRRYTHIEFATERVQIAPGEHIDVMAQVTTDADAERSQRIVLRFDAELADNADISTYASVAFDIVPVFARMRPKAANTPLSLSLETVGDESGATPQATIHAAGKMLGGDVRVTATVAETPRRKLYGQEPQITVQYARENATVTVGDHSTYTSPMTLTGERGVGLAAGYQKEAWSVKGSVQRSRTIIPVQERAVLSGTWHRSETSELSANLLHRNEFYDGTLLTFRSLSRPFGPTSKLDLECGISNSRALQDPSCMLQSVGSTKRVSYQLRAQRASIDFPGTLAGTRMVSAFTSYRIADAWRMEQMSTLMKRDVGSGAQRHNFYAKVGLNYSARISDGSLYATVHGIHSTARYSLLEGTTERIQNTLRLSAGYHLRRKGLTVSYEQGSASTDAVSGPASLMRLRLNGRYSLTEKVHLNSTFEHSQGNLSSTAIDQRNRQLGLGATVAFRPDLRLSVTAFRSVVESHFKQQYASLRAGVSKTFRSGKVLSLRAQFNHNEGRQTLRTADYRIAFTTPLAIPFTGGRKAEDILNGRVVDHVTGAPIPDVLLFLGNDLAITDEKGRFKFLKPGQDIVFLRIDASTIGYDRVPVLPMPMEIGPERFNGEELLIPISGTATVSGLIQVFRNTSSGQNLIGASKDELIPAGGLGSAVVQIEGETLRQRTRTSRDGSFTFPQLPPGMYTVTVVRSNLDANQRIESESLKVLVEMGEVSSLVFRVVPARKRIKMLKSSSLSLGTGATLKSEVSSVSTSLDEGPTPERKADSNTTLANPGSQDAGSTSEASPATVSASSTVPSSNDWLNSLKQTARAEAAAESQTVGAGTMPFYLKRGTPQDDRPNPAYPLLFVLCILFLLVDADLLVRSIMAERNGGIRSLTEPSWMGTARFGIMYAFAITTATVAAGPLAGLSVSLALSGLSVAIETRDTYRAILNVILLQLVARRKVGDWMVLRNSIVQLRTVTLTETLVMHVNGMESSIPTHRLHALGSLRARQTRYESADFDIVFSRLSNLRQIRSMLEETLAVFRPGTRDNCLEIVFEDIDTRWTSVRVRMIAEARHENLPLAAGMAEARLMQASIPLKGHHQSRELVHDTPEPDSSWVSASDTVRRTPASPDPESSIPASEPSIKPPTHLRLIKGGNHRAA